jgi:hypothetical protein
MNASLPDQKTDNICPFLGLPTDWQTAMDYPSWQNFCRLAKPPAAPAESYQREFCLSNIYTQCHLYPGDLAPSIPPAGTGEPVRTRKRNPLWLWIVAGLVAVIAITLILWQIIYRVIPAASTSAFIPAVSSTLQSEATAAIPSQPVPTVEPTLEVQQQFSPLIEITAEPAATAGPPHLLETPFGVDRQFLLHQVSSGEDLISIASTYQTSVEAIRAVNFNMPQELWVGTTIIIPFGQMDAAGMTPMTAYEIPSDGISIETLALEKRVDPEALTALNSRPGSYLFQTGEWVILPLSLTTP